MTNKYHMRNALVYFDDNDISANANQLAFTMPISNADTSCFGDDADTHEQGPYGWSATMQGFSAGNGTAGLTDKLMALKTGGKKKFTAYPQGGAANNHYLYGVASMSNLGVSGSRKDAAAFQLALQGSGTINNYATS